MIIVSLIEIVAILGIFTDILIICFIYKTLNQNSNQFFLINQPLFDLKFKGIDGDDNCTLLLKNYGQMIASDITISCVNNVSIKDETGLKLNFNYLFPTQEQEIYPNIWGTMLRNDKLIYDIDMNIIIKYKTKNKSKQITYNLIVNNDSPYEYVRISLLDFIE